MRCYVECWGRLDPILFFSFYKNKDGTDEEISDDLLHLSDKGIGKKVYAIYGVCNIRNFLCYLELLEEESLLLINEISDIIHEIVLDHLGDIVSFNGKNGCEFLFVWKFEESLT